MKRKNLAKAFYDFAKLAFAGLVIAPLATHAEKIDLIPGFATVVILLTTAWILDKEEEKDA